MLLNQETASSLEYDPNTEYQFVDNICSDPRQPNLGFRMYTASGATGQTFEGENLIPRELEFFNLLRFAYQTPEFEEVYNSPP